MVVVLTGKNTYALHSTLHQIINEFNSKYGDSVERFDGSEMTSADNVLDAVRSLSFLEPRKLVLVRDFSSSSDLMSKIESIVEQTADTTDLLLVDSKLDKRTAGYKYLKKSCDLRTFDDLQPYELERWVIEQAKNLGTKLANTDAKFLVDRVGPNQQQLSQEISKLSLLGSDISRKSIEELVEPNPQSKVFDMLEALFSGNYKKAQELYEDQRSQGEEPQKLLAMITWQLQQLTLAVYAPVKTVDALVANSKISPYSAQKALGLAKNISKSDLKFYITELASIDALSKTSADVESALAVYFSEVSFAKS
jgi:DNA polymerase III delta subunit